MNRLMTTKKMPVITKVIVSVSSMSRQFDASGVVHQGLTRWNTTETTTITKSAMAMAMGDLFLAGGSRRRCHEVFCYCYCLRPRLLTPPSNCDTGSTKHIELSAS